MCPWQFLASETTSPESWQSRILLKLPRRNDGTENVSAQFGTVLSALRHALTENDLTGYCDQARQSSRTRSAYTANEQIETDVLSNLI